MPTKIFEGLGPGTLIPRRGTIPIDDPRVGMEEGFVLSRVDGHTSLQEICMLVPFDEPVVMIMLRRLWEIGAIDVPGVARTMILRPPPAPPRETVALETVALETVALETVAFEGVPIDAPLETVPLEGVPLAIALSEVSAPSAVIDDEPQTNRIVAPPAARPPTMEETLSVEARHRIDGFYMSLDSRNAFDLLEIAATADARDVKRAYFRLSKEFHPDRYFGRELGPYADRLSKIFQAVKAAFELLSDPGRRAAYEEALGLK